MTVQSYDRDGVVAEVDHPSGDVVGVAVLTHGAGGNRNATILRAYAGQLCERGYLVARIDLPYRQRRPKGPPSPSGAANDRDGIRAAIEVFRDQASGPLIVGGHSYGGRQASMVVADDAEVATALLLSSYPLHPPGKPERARTEHLPQISVPTVIVHGASDPFATTAEIEAAADLIGAPTQLVEIASIGHDLRPDRSHAAPLAVDAIASLLDRAR